MLEAALPSPQAAPAYDKDGREIAPMTLANMREHEKGASARTPARLVHPREWIFQSADSYLKDSLSLTR
jgi:hypothetical protein